MQHHPLIQATHRLAVDLHAGVAVAHATQLDTTLRGDLHTGQAAQRIGQVTTIAEAGEVFMLKRTGVGIVAERVAVRDGDRGKFCGKTGAGSGQQCQKWQGITKYKQAHKPESIPEKYTLFLKLVFS